MTVTREILTMGLQDPFHLKTDLIIMYNCPLTFKKFKDSKNFQLMSADMQTAKADVGQYLGQMV